MAYIPTVWGTGDVITEERMNHLEQGVANEQIGPPGPAGQDGAPGRDGTDGKDGATPYIGANGNWWIGTADTGVPASGQSDSGVTSFKGRTGAVVPQAGDYTAADVGARSSTWMPTAAQVGAIPNTTIATLSLLTESEYTALSSKSATTLYLIKE